MKYYEDMLKKETIGNFLKLFIPIVISLLGGCVAWAFTVEQRAARVESRQEVIQDSLKEMKSDIHDIKTIIIEQITKKHD